jgi:hypothetical protein
MEKIRLTDPLTLPADPVLKEELGSAFEAYSAFRQLLAGDEFNVVPEWNYYKDGNAWLCKFMHRKKNLMWLSVWGEYFKVAFYFTEKTMGGIAELPIALELKEQISNAKEIGKLIPLVFTIRETEQLDDLMQVVRYKKGLK